MEIDILIFIRRRFSIKLNMIAHELGFRLVAIASKIEKTRKDEKKRKFGETSRVKKARLGQVKLNQDKVTIEKSYKNCD